MKRIVPLLLVLLVLFFASSLGAQEPDSGNLAKKIEALEAQLKKVETDSASSVVTDTLWVLFAAILVFFMNLGFGCVESGFCRAKNCVNILSKNFIVFAAASIAFWLVGWGLMFGNGNWLFGTDSVFLVSGDEAAGAYSAIDWTSVPLWAKFFFQLVFAGTAATIVSGVVAERIKYPTFIVFIFLMTIFLYPVVGHWVWGGGMLAPGKLFGEGKGFHDFAGSTVVHSVGGWAGLVGAIFLGARIGKYGKDGRPNAIPGHNLSLATIGCFVLWFGWFGFNPGSTMGASNTELIARICVTTNASAAAGILSATVTAWLMLGKPDLAMTLNGCLAGLVAITAPCSVVTVADSVLIGLVAGALVVAAVLWFDRLRIDDPVGALSVHLVNGIWGTLCVGLFGRTSLNSDLPHNGLFAGGGVAQLWPQIAGIVIVGAYVLAAGAAVWLILRATMGLRVSAAEETEGLDIGEHGNEAYPGFVVAAEMELRPGVSDQPKRSTVPPPDAKRYRVVVDGVEGAKLKEVWEKVCTPNGHEQPTELKDVYPYLTTVQGSTFNFRGGEPENVRKNLEKILQDKVSGGSVSARVSE